MLTLSQILLVVVVTLLSVLLTIFSIYTFRILEQVKRSLEKTNSMLDDMKRITKAIADPVEHAAEFVGGLKKGARLVELAGKLLDKKHSQPKKASGCAIGGINILARSRTSGRSCNSKPRLRSKNLCPAAAPNPHPKNILFTTPASGWESNFLFCC